MTWITLTPRYRLPTSGSAGKSLDICPRTCPTEDSRLCTYKDWFVRPAGRYARSLLDLPLSMRCMQRLLRFRMSCHKLPRNTGCWLHVPKSNRICILCQQGTYQI